MKRLEKLDLIVKAMRGEAKIEVYSGHLGAWFTLDYYEAETELFHSSHFGTWTIGFLMDNEIREKNIKPLLTQEECEFLKYFSQDLWIARDSDLSLVVYKEKPVKEAKSWFDGGDFSFISSAISLKFNGIKWADKECFTIRELIANAKENK